MNRKYPVVKQKQDERDYVFVGAIDLLSLQKEQKLTWLFTVNKWQLS